MKTRWATRTAIGAIASALLAAIVCLAACGGDGEQAATGPAASSPATTPLSLSTWTPEPYVSSWEAGTDDLAATRALAARYARALRSESISARVGSLYADQATLDNLVDRTAVTEPATIRGVWEGWEEHLQWLAGSTVYTAPGVVVRVTAVTDDAASPTVILPTLSLLAVSGGKVVQEEVYGDAHETVAMTRGWRALATGPGPEDTAAAATAAARIVSNVCAQTAEYDSLARVYARDIVFLDASTARPLHGVEAAIAWHERTTHIEGVDTVMFDAPVAGPGWAVLRWTASGSTADGPVSLPGVTLLELRDGKIVRSMVFYDSSVLDLSP